MSLSIGIVGLPNVGKSTLFNVLTKGNILAANYPFATIEPNTGVVPVPDERLNNLAKIYESKKVTPATIEFVDIAGLVAGASQGEGLGNKFLANIRECQAIVHIVRAFQDSDVIHVDDTIDPKKDIETINTELILADLQSIESKITKLAKEAKADPKKRQQQDSLLIIKKELESGKMLNQLSEAEKQSAIGLNLLTGKPVIYVFNISEKDLHNQEKMDQLSNLVKPNPSLFIAVKLENELKDLSQDEAKQFLESFGINESGLVQLVKTAYDLLGLQSYLTAGKDETRAWTIKKGASAPEAAGVIHTDFEKGFIAAQIISYDDLLSYGNETRAKEAGKLRTEGRTYIMQPNDVVEFRFNV